MRDFKVSTVDRCFFASAAAAAAAQTMLIECSTYATVILYTVRLRGLVRSRRLVAWHSG